MEFSFDPEELKLESELKVSLFWFLVLSTDVEHSIASLELLDLSCCLPGPIKASTFHIGNFQVFVRNLK